ncbi:diacylglycerol kinase family protein [Vagococcus humatus]|uniref:UDP kinase n=1 Tax=Vagococcus humatus TaxID=1889241 RepID=A0A429Z790_9ENTE|nr:diacylglycerol kinase family protein [Vagococcus humatus]RST89561.1 UDP kinase [Vagococcus humatus]
MAYKDKGSQDFKNKTFLSSFEFAVQGLRTVFKEERNMRKHCRVAVLVILLGFFFHLSISEWLWTLLVVFLVIVMEIINTTVENIVDLVTNYHFHPLAKKAKDMAAGAVLFTALLAVVVGSFIFLPKIWLFIVH